MNENNTEPDNENELLQSVKDKLAIEWGEPAWFMLTQEQRAHLVDKVALRYAELINKQK